MAIAGEIFFGSPKEDHKHTMEYGDHATKNIKIITTDICKTREQTHNYYYLKTKASQQNLITKAHAPG